MQAIMGYGVPPTPGIGSDGKVFHTGGVHNLFSLLFLAATHVKH